MTTSADVASTPQDRSTESAPLSRRDVLISSIVLPVAASIPAAAQAAGDAPRALTARTRDNLIAFSRLLGHVRHFHPSDQAARISWDSFAVRGVKRVEDCADPAALMAALSELFAPIAPTVRIFNADQEGAPEAQPATFAAPKVVRWQHYGAGQVSATESKYNVYQSRRIWLEAAATKPERPYTAVLGGGVAAAVPLVLEADAEGTLPHRPQPDEPASGEAAFSGNDRSTRLAAVALGWNVLQHFYPYFDLVDTD